MCLFAIIIFFSGIGNIVRMPYLIFFHSSDNYQKNFFSLTRKKYNYYLTSSKIIINLSSRKVPGVRIFTGRSVQAISSKSLALEEKNKSMEVLHTPFKHYIPFDSVREFSIALQFIKKYSDLVDSIIKESYGYYCNNYRSDFGWKRILNLCNL